MISLRDVENRREWDDYAEGRGEVVIPLNRDARLCVSYKAMSDLSPLSTLLADDLQVLEITCTRKLEDTQLRHIQGLTGLLGLALWETDIGDAACMYLGRMSNLRWLDIGDTQITDEGLAFIRRMPYLEELTLLNTQIGNAGLQHLAGLSKLKRLDLKRTKVSDAGFELLRKLPGLESLRITDTAISYPVYARLKSALPGCEIEYRECARI
ncbi:MAG TPA: hypothetical protein VIQ24_00600 [Pyrinomonadaceae bacterium]